MSLKIESPNDIDIKNISWQFWQKSYGYDYGNGYVCLFDCDTQFVSRKDGPPCVNLGGCSINFGHYISVGTFSIYRKFKMSNGQEGIEISKPFRTISIKKDTTGKGLDDFKKLGIFEVYNLLNNETIGFIS